MELQGRATKLSTPFQFYESLSLSPSRRRFASPLSSTRDMRKAITLHTLARTIDVIDELVRMSPPFLPAIRMDGDRA